MKERVLVTGGAGGIGSAICERLDADGYDVVILDRTGPGIHVDLSNAADLRRAMQIALADGPIERVVNNVGGTNAAWLENVGENDLDTLWALNVKSTIFVTQALLPSMRTRGFGRIVNISSVAAQGKLEKTAYSATKAAVLGLTRTWALELGRHGITSNAVAPGAIRTPMFEAANPLDDPAVQAALASLPIRRMGEPADVANTVAYLLDERTGYVTGQTHAVCGGFSIGKAAM